jgi:hypothetical protein
LSTSKLCTVSELHEAICNYIARNSGLSTEEIALHYNEIKIKTNSGNVDFYGAILRNR